MSLFSEGRLYRCISDGVNCCTFHFRLTALIAWDVPPEVVKYKQNGFERLVLFRLTYNWIQIKGLAFSDKWLIDCKCPLNCQLHYKRVSKCHYLARGGCISLQQAVCILKCAVSIGHYTNTVCIIQCEVFIVPPTVCSAHLFPC